MSPSEMKHTSLLTTLSYEITDKLQDAGVALGEEEKIVKVRTIIFDALAESIPAEITSYCDVFRDEQSGCVLPGAPHNRVIVLK